jgi:hypothetical protein
MAFVPENNENGESLDPYNLARREPSRGNTPVKKSTKKNYCQKLNIKLNKSWREKNEDELQALRKLPHT